MKDYADKQVAPEALYYLALTYQELGANGWAVEKLQLLTEKYPNSQFSGDGRRLLAKLDKKPSSSQPSVVAKTAPPTLTADPLPSCLLPRRPHPGPLPSGHRPTNANPLRAGLSLRQPFVSCRLGAWC